MNYRVIAVDFDGTLCEEKLLKAVEWCSLHGLTFDAINKNLQEIIEKYGGDTRKISADEYIDDKMCSKFKLPYKFTKGG